MPRIAAVLSLATTAAVLALAPSASAAVTCEYQAPGILSVSIGADNDGTLLAVSATGDIQVRGGGPVLACAGGTPTVTNTDNILVVDNSDDPNTPESGDGSTHLSILDPAAFGPGKTQEQGSDAFSEIEFIVNLNKGFRDRLYLSGTLGDDNWVLGKSGLNWNAASGDPAPDSEMLSSQIDETQVGGSAGNDRFSAQGGSGTGGAVDSGFLRLTGDTDDDVLESGDGPGDVLEGGTGNDTLRGFAGDDQLVGDPNVGGTGDDVLDGGAGAHDVANFTQAQGPVTVDLSSTAPQNSGHGNDTFVGVEDVLGSEFADTLTGNSSANRLAGNVGDDTLEGRAGDDALEGGFGSDTLSYASAPAGVVADLTAGTATGGAASDTLVGNENLVGSPFPDTLTGSAAANRIVGGAGVDIISALAGADNVDARDGGADSVSCGSELDSATADRRTVDSVDADCETTDFLPEPPPATGVGGTPDAGGGAPPTVTPDRTLRFDLSGARTQRVLRTKAVLVKVRCPLEQCTTVARGKGKSGLKPKPVTAKLGGGAARTLKLRLSRKQLATLRTALAAGKRPKVKVTVKAKDAAGNLVTRTLTVKVAK